MLVVELVCVSVCSWTLSGAELDGMLALLQRYYAGALKLSVIIEKDALMHHKTHLYQEVLGVVMASLMAFLI